MLDSIHIEVTKTSDGRFDYVQIASPAAMPVNIVLIAGKIVVSDRRPVEPEKKQQARGGK